MGYDAAVLRRASRRLAEARQAREEFHSQRRREILRRIPEIADIDRELKETIIAAVQLSLQHGKDPLPGLRHARERNQALQTRRAGLLAACGYPPDALDDPPACARCGDSGWVGTQMCGCLRALCREEQIKELSKLLDLGGQSFDQFSLDYYSTQPWPGETATPRDNMEFIWEVCREYAARFGQFYFKNLFLTGRPGLGKTFLSACIARAVADQGFSVVYDTAVQVFSRFEDQKFLRDADGNRAARDETRKYLGCDLLILDDLGSEMTTPFVQSALYTLVNSRLVAGQCSVISSNLSMDEVRQRYSGQAASRLGGEYRILRFYGEDIRLQRKQKGRQ